MIKRLLFFLWISLQPLFTAGQHVEPGEINLKDITLTSIEGKTDKIRFQSQKIISFVILGVDCPISQKYIPVVEKLSIAYRDSVQWVAVFPQYFSREAVALFKKEYALNVPCYIDHDMKLIRRLKSTVTPEVFLIDPEFKIQYAGAIDDWFYDLGHYRATITHHYLKDAIEALMNGREIEKRATVAVGCPIETSKSGKPTHTHH